MTIRGPSEVVVVRSDYGLPYSKGLMAQSIMATGLPPERSFALAAADRAAAGRARPRPRSSVEELRARRGGRARVRGGASRSSPAFASGGALRRLDRPLVVLLGGVTGVGKSTVATQLANRLGITRVIATDQVRQVVRAFFSHDFMPAVHHSSFDVATGAPGR